LRHIHARLPVQWQHGRVAKSPYGRKVREQAMMNSSSGITADGRSRTLVSGHVRSRRRKHFGSGLTSFPSNAHNQLSESANTVVKTPSLLASIITLGALYLWWARLMILQITGRHRAPVDFDETWDANREENAKAGLSSR
jgi:hypothetical protein